MQIGRGTFFTSRSVVLVCLLVAAGYFIAMRHWQHFLEFFPYLVLLACPLMHLFGGHRHTGDTDAHHEPRAKAQEVPHGQERSQSGNQ